MVVCFSYIKCADASMINKLQGTEQNRIISQSFKDVERGIRFTLFWTYH